MAQSMKYPSLQAQRSTGPQDQMGMKIQDSEKWTPCSRKPQHRCPGVKLNSIVNTKAPFALRGVAFLHYNGVTELVRLEKTLRPLSPTTNLTVPDPSLNYVSKSHIYMSCYKPEK